MNIEKHTRHSLPISVIVTVLNEEESIVQLLRALALQKYLPSEIIIADGGSTDATVEKIETFAGSKMGSKVSIKVLDTPGNRSVGRNAAIAAARSKYVAITDAGCVPHPEWIQELVLTKEEVGVAVVAGASIPFKETRFQSAAAPYFLIMPDRIDPKTFLPATRSMLLEKKVWRSVGKFDESLQHNEDYAFAHQLRKQGVLPAYSEKAIVAWMPPKNLSLFSKTIFRFALGDCEAGIVRTKVVLLFLRYAVATGIAISLYQISPTTAAITLAGLGMVYSIWAILKQLHYAPHSWYYFPVLQFVADGAVMVGSIIGTLSWLRRRLQR